MPFHHIRLRLCLLIVFILLNCIFPAAPAFAQSKLDENSATAIAPWLDAQLSDGIVYLLYANPPSIKRYQLSTETWLPDLTLSGTPTAFRVTADAIYVGFGVTAVRLLLDGTGETSLLTADWPIIALHISGTIMIVNHTHDIYGNLISFDLSTLGVIDKVSYYPYAMIGSSLAPGIRKLFGRTQGISPDGIRMAGFNADGLFTGATGGVNYASASKTWVSPNEDAVIDNGGMIYSTDNLKYRGSLLGQVDDLAFSGDQTVVLRGKTLVGFTNTYLETGSVNLDTALANIFASGDTIYGFYNTTDGPQVIKIPVGSLTPPLPGPKIDPIGLNFVPDKVLIGSDETVYLLSKQYKSIFRWNLAQKRYLDTIPLLDAPYDMAYSASENRLYTVYSIGSLYKIELNGDLLETPFASVPDSLCGLLATGSFVFTCVNDGSSSHINFSPAGQVLSIKNFLIHSAGHAWNTVHQKMYMISLHSYDGLAWENIDADGVIGDIRDFTGYPYTNLNAPLRVKPDGSVILTGSGLIFDGLSLAYINTLPNQISDAGWQGDTLVTLHPFSSASELQQWTENLTVAKTVQVNGGPVNLFPVSAGWLVVTNLSGRIRFTLCSLDLECTEPPVADFSVAPTQGRVPLEVHFTNLSSEDLYTSSLWDFGDGSSSTNPNPDYIYTKADTYDVKLTVSGPGGSDTLIRNGIIQVGPIAADFSVSSIQGQAPLTVKFTNQTQGGYSTVFWDFGDGTTGTEDNPSHIYQNPGIYSVSLTVDGDYGSGTVVKNNIITATLLAYIHMPIIRNYRPPLLLPGHYPFDNLCSTYDLTIRDTYIGQMKECVPSVDIDNFGFMYFNYSWTLTQSGAGGCVVKYSDWGNPNMYIKDSSGLRYNQIDAGGSQYVDCMQSGYTYIGWFKFPPATTKNTDFTFFDDDAGIQIKPITLSSAP